MRALVRIARPGRLDEIRVIDLAGNASEELLTYPAWSNLWAFKLRPFDMAGRDFTICRTAAEPEYRRAA